MIPKSFEEDDPMELVGVELVTPEDYDAFGEMARAFIAEYAMMGFSRDQILRIFQNPLYQGPHAIYASRGENYVCDLIDEILGARKQDLSQEVQDAQGL
jgi:hypothetical protein